MVIIHQEGSSKDKKHSSKICLNIELKVILFKH